MVELYHVIDQNSNFPGAEIILKIINELFTGGNLRYTVRGHEDPRNLREIYINFKTVSID